MSQVVIEHFTSQKKMYMKKIYVTPNTLDICLRKVCLLSSNSLHVYSEESDPVVDNSEQVFSRRKDSNIWEDDNDEDLP